MSIKEIDYQTEASNRKTSVFRESPIFSAIIESIVTPYVEQQKKFLWLAENLLNIDLATGYQLDVIGMVVNQDRSLVDFSTAPYFGFQGAYQAETFGTIDNPDVGGYWKSYSSFDTSSARRLNDDEYKRVIKARIIMNRSYCTYNDVLSVINLLNNHSNTTINCDTVGIIKITTSSLSDIANYFISRIDNSDNIIPIPIGYRILVAG